jgi:23S rRNA pseudouridine1911/1915/1917 synthase
VRFSLGERQRGERLDRVLHGVSPGFSRTFWARVARRGGVRVNGHPVRASKVLAAGDEVAFWLSALERPELLLDPGELGPPVYDDGEVVVFHKPAGLLTHPAGRVVLRAATVLAEEQLGAPMFPVHRLDKYTSGVLVMARHADVAARLGERLRDRRVVKVYWCLTRTPPAEDEFQVDLALEQTGEEHVKLKMLPFPEGKPAVTDFRVLERFREGALIEARPRTGRQHQIRAHLLHVGAPIVGDMLYGPGEDWSYFDDLDERKHAVADGRWHALHSRVLGVPDWEGGPLEVEVAPAGAFAAELARWRG